MLNVTVLGATGSVGKATLSVLEGMKVSIFALTAKENVESLISLAKKYKPRFVVLKDEESAEKMKKALSEREVRVLSGQEGLLHVCTHKEVDVIVSAIPGLDGLIPTMEAARASKTILLAAKEIVVAAGALFMNTARRSRAKILPIDTEHNALFQAMKGHRKRDISKIIITASGGPFWSLEKERLHDIKPADALAHPKWKMGKKITVDSATLMNKGFEVIEAHHLFGIELEKIKVLIHPECIIHALVEFVDGSVIACFFMPDIRIPISYALNYPHRKKMEKYIHFFNKSLSFHEPDVEHFPLLPLAYEVGREGGSLPAALVGADEEAVNMFLEGKIKFTEIAQIIKKVLKAHRICTNPSLDDIINAYDWAKKEVKKI